MACCLQASYDASCNHKGDSRDAGGSGSCRPNRGQLESVALITGSTYSLYGIQGWPPWPACRPALVERVNMGSGQSVDVSVAVDYGHACAVCGCAICQM